MHLFDHAPSPQELLDRWPKDPEGNPEEPVLLTTQPDAGGTADMTAAMLEAFGIPVLKQYRSGGGAGRIILGFSGYGADLYVPVSRLEEARQLLADPPETPSET